MKRAWIALLLIGCAAPLVEPGLRAGTAKAKITPTEPVMMAGYGSRNKPSEGVAADRVDPDQPPRNPARTTP